MVSRKVLTKCFLGAVHKLCRLGRVEGGSPKNDLLHRPYLIKKTTRGRGSKLPILRQNSLWTAPKMSVIFCLRALVDLKCQGEYLFLEPTRESSSLF